MTNGTQTSACFPRRHALLGACAVLALLLFLPLPSHAQTFNVLYKFSGNSDGQNPLGGVIVDVSGNVYGTTLTGGVSDPCGTIGPGCGTVFKLDRHGNKTVLHRFTGYPTDGANPDAGVALDASGNVYGTTEDGGTLGYGTVFKITPSGEETVFFSFNSTASGQYPYGGLVVGPDGTIYGTAQEGGPSDQCWGGCGVVFKLDTAGNETILLDIWPPAAYPTETLTMDAAGHRYGITSGTGYCCLGTIFELTENNVVPPRTLYTFKGGLGGETPRSAVIRDAQGNLYGTASLGGDSGCTYGRGAGCGIVYQLTPDGEEKVLHTFTGPDGGYPGGLIRGRDGNLYGTTSEGGAFGYGTVFKLDKHGNFTILHSFASTDGARPYSGVVQDATGNLYGTTYYGGNLAACNPPLGCGVVFKITPWP